MDWCVDSRVGGATDVLVEQVGMHLARRSQDARSVAESAGVTRASLEALSPGRHWIRVTWDAEAPLLQLAPADVDDDAPLPGEAVAAGVSLAHRPSASVAPATGGAVRVALPATRPSQPDLAPVRLDEGDGLAPEWLVAGVAATLASRTSRGSSAVNAADEAGRAAAVVAAAGRRPSLDGPATPGEIAEAFAAYHRAAGGAPVVQSADERSAVIVNHRCPFGDAVVGVPELCRATSALLGATAVRLAGPVNVVIDESFGLGDHQCRFHLALGDEPVPGAHRYRAAVDGDDGDGEPFRIDLTIHLPRDRTSVPVIRHLVQAKLTELGVVDEDIDDVALALTEACTNVIDHAGPGSAYDVVSAIGPELYEIQVIDVGRGFDRAALPAARGPEDETGRGVSLMHALMDDVSLASAHDEGTVVSLRKRLRFRDGAPAHGLVVPPPDGRGRLGP